MNGRGPRHRRPGATKRAGFEFGGRATPQAPAVKAAATAGPLFQKITEPGALEVREGEVLRVTYESDETGFRVLRVVTPDSTEPETWVGVVPSAQAGMQVRATGKRIQDPRHGEQFKLETLLVVAPETSVGIERYLGSGIVKGVGPVLAKRIVEAFGVKTLEVLDSSPQRLHDVVGLGAKRADGIASAWVEHRALGAIMIFLQQHGASPALASRIYKRFGPRAIDIVSRSPYRLALDVWGVGFKTADRIARSVGIALDAPERAQAGVLQVLYDDASQGHVFAVASDLAERTSQLLEVDAALVRDAIGSLGETGHVRVEALARSRGTESESALALVDGLDPGEAVFTANLYEAEARLADMLVKLVREESPRARALASIADAALAKFEKKSRLELAPAQREAVLAAASHRVLVLTGGPGVGKTTIVRALLALFDEARMNVRLAAPTGRAAKRMSEATGREASTLHRMLEFDPKRRQFARRAGKPIECDVLVVDEASMVDVELAEALLQSLPDHARLVLVGDVDQLPSVGPGAVLRDVITSGVVPTVRLTQIFRQAEGSLIVKNAHRMHAGEPPESADGVNGEFYVLPRDSAEAAASTLLELVTQRIPKRFGLDPIRDVQVLTPMNKGPAGAIQLNKDLQAVLNPGGASVVKGERVYKVGDKVMQLKNDYDREVWNGDVGFVTKIDPEVRSLTVKFDDREVQFEDGDLDELVLAYATTIHKSQGSEYPAVVIPLVTHHFVMLSRNLLYTAVTRGKRLVVLVADPRAVALALGETRKDERRTRLAERLVTAGAR